MSEVSELIPPPAGGAGDGVDGVDEVGSSGALGASDEAAAPPQFRPILPTLPPRPSKTAGATASPVAPSDAAPAEAPKLLTAPPLVAPPLVAPPTGAPVLAAPTVPAATSSTGLATLPPPSTAPVVVDLPAPAPAAASLPVEGTVVPSLPTLGLAPARPGLAAMRLNLEPIEEVAARAHATVEHAPQAAHIAPETPEASEAPEASDVPSEAPSAFTNGSALSMLSSEPGAAPGATATSAPTGSTGPIVPTLASHRSTKTVDAGGEIDGDIDEAAIEQAAEDALAAAAAKSGDPHLLAAAAHFAAQKQAAALPPVKVRGAKRPKRRRGRYVLLALVLVAGSGSAYVFRDSPIMQKARGVGYDPQALPATVYERPAPGTVSLEHVMRTVTKGPSGELVSMESLTDATINPANGSGRFEVTTSRHPIVDGVAADVPESTESGQVIITDSTRFTRLPGAEPGVWQSNPRTSTGPTSWPTPYMYQDIVDESLRRVRPVSTETRVEGTESLTTYTWEIPRGEFYESAPQLWALTSVLEGVADPESIVTVVLTVDTTGVVHLLDVALDLGSVIEHTLSTLDDGDGVSYRFRWELRSMSDESYVPPVPDGATPPTADPAAAVPAPGDPAADPSADPAATVPAQADPAAVPETVPATVPTAPVGG